jgi:transposase
MVELPQITKLKEADMATVYYIGLDVHKDSVQMAVVSDESVETIFEKKMANDPGLLVKVVKPYAEKGEVVVGYEAGCLGYVLQRAYAAAGIECLVLPADKVAKGRTDRIKTDRRDARLIARMLKSGGVKGIAVPGEEDEAVRDLLRCREDVKEEEKRAKQQLLKFLLRHGYSYSGKNNWTAAAWDWMNHLVFKEAVEKEVYEEYKSRIKSLEEREERLDKRIEELSQGKRYAKKVQTFRAFKGVDTLIAMSLVCELGDFRRFGKASDLMSYLGLVPSESSSGGKRRQGGITKAGNGHLRRLLIEAAWQYARGNQVGKRLSVRRVGCSAEVVEQADKALHRLNKKYGRLVLMKGKEKTVAITAVARELSGFLWAAGYKMDAGSLPVRTVPGSLAGSNSRERLVDEAMAA